MDLVSTHHGEYPIGTVFADATYKDLRNIHIRALLLSFRPLHCDTPLWETERLQLDPQPRRVAADAECIALSYKSPSGTLTRRWVDPVRGFIVIQETSHYPDGQRFSQVDIHYSKDPDFGWIPSAWEGSLFGAGSGRVLQTSDSIVTDYALNVPIPDHTFRIDFPIGTFVHDQKRAESYVVQEGARKRFVSSSDLEAGLSYHDLMQDSSSGTWTWRSWLTITGLLLVTAVIWRACRRRVCSH